MSVGTMASSVSDSPGAPLSGGTCCIAFTLLFKRSQGSSHFHDDRCAPRRSVVCLVRERRFKDCGAHLRAVTAVMEHQYITGLH